MPAPENRPQERSEPGQVAEPTEVPVPQQRPERRSVTAAESNEERAGTPARQKASQRPERAAPGEQDEEVISTAAGLPQVELSCRRALAELEAKFTEAEPLSDPAGCEASHPVELSALGPDIALEPPAVLNCRMALATVRFVQDVANELARETFDADITGINQVSGYVCRARNGQEQLSEHAFGNALDWRSIEIEDKETVVVRGHRRGSDEALFLAALRKAACGPFKTVLGPGTDADHADHFHFDLARRSNGSTYCR